MCGSSNDAKAENPSPKGLTSSMYYNDSNEILERCRLHCVVESNICGLVMMPLTTISLV